MAANAVSIQLTQDDYTSAVRLLRPWTRTAIRYFLGIVFFALIILLFSRQGATKDQVLAFSASLGIGGAAVAIVLLASRYLAIPVRTRRIFRQQKTLQRPYEMSWDDAQVTTESANGRSLRPWSDFIGWRENDRIFLLATSEVLFQIVPKRSMSGSAQIADFRELLRHKIAPKPGIKRN